MLHALIKRVTALLCYLWKWFNKLLLGSNTSNNNGTDVLPLLGSVYSGRHPWMPRCKDVYSRSSGADVIPLCILYFLNRMLFHWFEMVICSTLCNSFVIYTLNIMGWIQIRAFRIAGMTQPQKKGEMKYWDMFYNSPALMELVCWIRILPVTEWHCSVVR